VPVGFIHLPYEPRQAARRREAVASMSLDVMERAVRLAIGLAARAAT
jgi:pyrrolidone-carboxylate peptidase